MNASSDFLAWAHVAHVLRAQPHGTVLRVPKWQYPHPIDAGAHVSIGLPMGQSADFRWTLPDCTGLHVRDFGTHFEAHVDAVDPGCGPIEHLRQDVPEAFVAGAAAIGALVGAVLGRSQSATLAGAGVGALVGIAALPAETRSAAFETVQSALRVFSQDSKPRSRGCGGKPHGKNGRGDV